MNIQNRLFKVTLMNNSKVIIKVFEKYFTKIFYLSNTNINRSEIQGMGVSR